MKKLVVLSGAGISAESGIKTFRDTDGLWEGHDVMEVASPEGWRKDPELVLEFYNQRRRQLKEVIPNRAHEILAELASDFDVQIVTQNVDDLHERAGSHHLLHLHGELKKSCSEWDKSLVYPCDGDIKLGELAEDGAQLRPFIVWFGEEVPLLSKAAQIVSTADILLIVGTSLQVYPAAGLINYTPPHCQKYLIDPKVSNKHFVDVKTIVKKATDGIDQFIEEIRK